MLFVSHDAAAVRALTQRAILLNAGRVVADGQPTDVLNRYQKLIMEREEAYEAARPPASADDVDGGDAAGEQRAPLRYTFRHGDGSAEFVEAELLDAARRRVEVVETGTPLQLRARAVFHADVDEPVFGFLIRDRHGIHVYGTNTEVQGLTFDTVRRGESVEITFSFDCWLGVGDFSFSLSAHSSVTRAGGVGYDWLDGVIFFRVTSGMAVEGVANLNASAFARRTRARAAAGEKAAPGELARHLST